jgi:hypothetical protein
MLQSFLSVDIHVIRPLKHEGAHFVGCFFRHLLGSWAQSSREPLIKINLLLQRVETPQTAERRHCLPAAAVMVSTQMCAISLQSKWRHVEDMADRNRLRDSVSFVYLWFI